MNDTEPEIPEEDLFKAKPPPTCASPRALRLCALARRMVNLSCLVAFLLIPIILLFSEGRLEILFGIEAFAFGITLLFVFMRFLIIAFLIARYSLRQMLGAIIILNVLLVSIVSLKGSWKALPYLWLTVFIFVVIFYILAQDPEGLGYTPGFMREYLKRKQKPPE